MRGTEQGTIGTEPQPRVSLLCSSVHAVALLNNADRGVKTDQNYCGQ